MTGVFTKLLWLAGLLALGAALASPAEAAGCKKGYERIGGKCVKKCKKGQGRLNGTGKCQNLCKSGQTRDDNGKCVTFLPDIGDGCHPPLTICHNEDLCEDNIWISAWVCQSWGFADTEGCDVIQSCECVVVSQSTDSTAVGSCGGS